MQRPIAFISDIHANLPALRAVLADIAQQDVGEIICLGDVVGYGGNPAECIDLVREARIPCLKGNHDALAAGDSSTRLDDTNPAARLAIEWTRRALSSEHRSWLAELPMTFERSDWQAVHATLNEPHEWEYVLTGSDAARNFRHQRLPLCFIGHTHQPAFWVEGEDRKRDITSIEPVTADRKQLVNVGSVGQPRDKDERACWLLHRPGKSDVWWRRVPYDIEFAQRAIIDAGLPAKFAERLGLGR